MDFNELREVGKVWILMGVFSTCFFASCGQGPTSPPESATPVAHTQPVPQEIEPKPVSLDHDYEAGEMYSEDHEGTGYGESDFNDMEQEIPEFTEDIPRPQPSSEDTDKSTQEVSSNTTVTANPEVALNATSDSPPDQNEAGASQEGSSQDEGNSSEDDASPIIAEQTDDDTEADDFTPEVSDDFDRA